MSRENRQADHGALIERLEAVRYVREGRDEQDYVCDLACDADDYGARSIPRNPDGHEAAKAIRKAASDLEQVSIERDGLREALPDLTAVIAWLENGCDPKHAATELRIHQARITAFLNNLSIPGQEAGSSGQAAKVSASTGGPR